MSNSLKKEYLMLLLLFPVIWSQVAYENTTFEEIKNENQELTVKADLSSVSPNIFQDWLNNPNDPIFEHLILEVGNITYQNCLIQSKVNRKWTSSAMRSIQNDFKFCLMEAQWSKFISNDKEVNARRFLTRNGPYFFLQRIKNSTEPKKMMDCFYDNRKETRTVPTACYWNKISSYKVREFWNFWNQNGPDLMYTFDFVLTSQTNVPFKFTNFWYITAFIKIMALYYHDPIELVNPIKQYKEQWIEYGKLKQKIDAIKSMMPLLNKKASLDIYKLPQ